jgi:hypothetical protein
VTSTRGAIKDDPQMSAPLFSRQPVRIVKYPAYGNSPGLAGTPFTTSVRAPGTVFGTVFAGRASAARAVYILKHYSSDLNDLSDLNETQYKHY